MNIAQAIMHLYPNALPIKDFLVQDDSDGRGAYLAVWNLEEPQPTEADLQAAWEEFEALPPVEEPESDAEKLARLERENTLLKAQVSASADRQDFLEDVISEVLMQVYQ